MKFSEIVQIIKKVMPKAKKGGHIYNNGS